MTIIPPSGQQQVTSTPSSKADKIEKKAIQPEIFKALREAYTTTRNLAVRAIRHISPQAAAKFETPKEKDLNAKIKEKEEKLHKLLMSIDDSPRKDGIIISTRRNDARKAVEAEFKTAMTLIQEGYEAVINDPNTMEIHKQTAITKKEADENLARKDLYRRELQVETKLLEARRELGKIKAEIAALKEEASDTSIKSSRGLKNIDRMARKVTDAITKNGFLNKHDKIQFEAQAHVIIASMEKLNPLKETLLTPDSIQEAYTEINKALSQLEIRKERAAIANNAPLVKEIDDSIIYIKSTPLFLKDPSIKLAQKQKEIKTLILSPQFKSKEAQAKLKLLQTQEIALLQTIALNASRNSNSPHSLPQQVETLPERKFRVEGELKALEDLVKKPENHSLVPQLNILKEAMKECLERLVKITSKKEVPSLSYDIQKISDAIKFFTEEVNHRQEIADLCSPEKTKLREFEHIKEALIAAKDQNCKLRLHTSSDGTKWLETQARNLGLKSRQGTSDTAKTTMSFILDSISEMKSSADIAVVKEILNLLKPTSQDSWAAATVKAHPDLVKKLSELHESIISLRLNETLKRIDETLGDSLKMTEEQKKIVKKLFQEPLKSLCESILNENNPDLENDLGFVFTTLLEKVNNLRSRQLESFREGRGALPPKDTFDLIRFSSAFDPLPSQLKNIKGITPEESRVLSDFFGTLIERAVPTNFQIATDCIQPFVTLWKVGEAGVPADLQTEEGLNDWLYNHLEKTRAEDLDGGPKDWVATHLEEDFKMGGRSIKAYMNANKVGKNPRGFVSRPKSRLVEQLKWTDVETNSDKPGERIFVKGSCKFSLLSPGGSIVNAETVLDLSPLGDLTREQVKVIFSSISETVPLIKFKRQGKPEEDLQVEEELTKQFNIAKVKLEEKGLKLTPEQFTTLSKIIEDFGLGIYNNVTWTFLHAGE